MRIDSLASRVCQHSSADVGKFYGSIQPATVGAGMIFDNVRYPLFNIQDQVYDTRSSLVYVLTHECDVDQSNSRYFNDHVVVCPLIPIETLVETQSEHGFSDDELQELLFQIAKRNVLRLVYFPPSGTFLKSGAVMYLNNLVSTHVLVFDNIKPVGAVSAYGLEQVDIALRNSLFRPKASRLSLQF